MGWNKRRGEIGKALWDRRIGRELRKGRMKREEKKYGKKIWD